MAAVDRNVHNNTSEQWEILFQAWLEPSNDMNLVVLHCESYSSMKYLQCFRFGPNFRREPSASTAWAAVDTRPLGCFHVANGKVEHQH